MTQTILLMITKYSRLICSYLLIFFGFSIVFWIIWVRFIRERLPKDIPFITSEMGFYILLYICCIYLFIIFTLLTPREPHPLITQLITYLFLPLTTLDESIKNNKYILPYYTKLCDYIMILIKESIEFEHMKILYILCQILPRAILVSFLLIDTFYFHKLELIYKVIILGLIPLTHRYLKYSLKALKEEYILTLETQYDEVWVLDDTYTKPAWELNPKAIHHDTKVSIKEYLDIQINEYWQDSEIKYTGTCFAKEDVYIQYEINNNKLNIKLTEEDYTIIKKEFKTIMPKLIDLSIFIMVYSSMDDYYIFKNIKIKWLRIIIYSLYFVCWAYILYKSFDEIYLYTNNGAIFKYHIMRKKLIIIQYIMMETIQAETKDMDTALIIEYLIDYIKTEEFKREVPAASSFIIEKSLVEAFVNQIDWLTIINNKDSNNDYQRIINDLFNNYINNLLESQSKNPWYCLMRNTIVICALISIVLLYSKVFIISLMITDPKSLLKLLIEINPIFKDLTPQQMLIIINEYFKSKP